MKRRHTKPKAYFQITEDPPKKLEESVTSTSQSRSPLKLPIQKQFFFIDFTQGCCLRTMQKIKEKIEIKNPIQFEKYGQFVITNLEDCSKNQQQLIKFQEQKRELLQKKKQIRSKVKQNLDKSKTKLRSLSSFFIKQNLIDQYSKPSTINAKYDQISSPTQSKLQLHDKRLRQKQQKVLKRLGLYI